jgi:light-regulated signal transduction histidine kinase (bacteriophytochrome)
MINVTQAYGALIIVNKELGEIIQVSENLVTVLGKPLKDIIGKPIRNFIPTIPPASTAKDKVPQKLSLNGIDYLGFIHNKATYYIIEINLESANEASDGTFIDVYKDLREAMSKMDYSGSLREAAEISARELKKVSGFDKVMLYRFDSDWNGHVMAEEKEDGMESYLNFTFPASDIPKQARDLYEKNPYRFIPDTQYMPVKLYPVINPATHTFIDLSDCNVRGVSSVHLEYLSNMHVKASMSTRIMKDGKLWGLIACHHRTAMKVSYKVCAIFELMSGIFSARISSLESKEAHGLNTSLSERYTSLVEETYRSGDMPGSLLSDENNILDLFGAGGAIVIQKGNSFTKGNVPDQNEVEDIVLWLNTKEIENIYVTDNLGREYDYATEYSDHASGLMAIPVDVTNGEYILLFRPEVVQTINWGGDPNQRINFEEDMKTYHPRFSFKLWKENVKGVSLPWKKEEIEMAESLLDFVRDYSNGKFYNKN